MGFFSILFIAGGFCRRFYVFYDFVCFFSSFLCLFLCLWVILRPILRFVSDSFHILEAHKVLPLGSCWINGEDGGSVDLFIKPSVLPTNQTPKN